MNKTIPCYILYPHVWKINTRYSAQKSLIFPTSWIWCPQLENIFHLQMLPLPVYPKNKYFCQNFLISTAEWLMWFTSISTLLLYGLLMGNILCLLLQSLLTNSGNNRTWRHSKLVLTLLKVMLIMPG